MTFTPTDPTKAEVRVTGTAPNQELEFYIPRGGKGDPGNNGATGPANTLQIGTVTTSAAGGNAAATITGSAPTQALNLTIPAGPATNFTVLGTATGASNPTPFELRGTGMPNGVVTAAIGTYYTDMVGTNGAWRWLKTSGAGNTGWEVTTADTGLRDISTLATGASSSAFTVRRLGNTVFLNGRGVLTVSGYGALLLTLPSGFQPGLSGMDNDHFWWEAYGTFKTAFIENTGAFKLGNSPTLSAAVSVRTSFATKQAWPTTLPGTPA